MTFPSAQPKANDQQAPAARSVSKEQLQQITSTCGAGDEMHGSYKSQKAGAGFGVEGTFNGKIIFPEGGVVHIAPGGVVEASEIEADIVLIEGKFNGTVTARLLCEITSSAVIEGEIKYADLDMHRGARVMGQLHAIAQDQVQRTTDKPTAKSSSDPATRPNALLSMVSSTGSASGTKEIGSGDKLQQQDSAVSAVG